jgi:hypothetical protein
MGVRLVTESRSGASACVRAFVTRRRLLEVFIVGNSNEMPRNRRNQKRGRREPDTFDPNDLDALIEKRANPPIGWVKLRESLTGGRVRGPPPTMIDHLRFLRSMYDAFLIECDRLSDEEEYYHEILRERLVKYTPWSEERKADRRQKCRDMIAVVDARIAALENSAAQSFFT